MTSISATLQISAGDLSALQALPLQLENLVGTARQSLKSITDGEGNGNAISKLLGNLEVLGGQAASLPDLGPLLVPIQSIVKELPSAGFVSLAALKGGVDETLDVIGPVKDLILSGKLDVTLQEGAQRAVEAVGGLLRPGDATAGPLGQLEQFFLLFQSIHSWRVKPPNPQALVELLAQLLIGTSTDLLEKPYALLRETLAPLDNVLAEGVDLASWRSAFPARLSQWQELNAHMAGPNINWNEVESKLQAELRVMIQLRATRDRLISATLSNLTRINLSGLGQVGVAVASVQRPPEFRLGSITDGIRGHLESLAKSLETWEPTPDELRAVVNGLTGSFRKFLEESPLGELRALLLRFHHRLMLAIEALPFRTLAAKVEQALRKVADAINVVDPDLIRKPIREFFETVDAKIKEIPVAEIIKAVNAVWKTVDDVFQQVGTQLENLKNTLQGLVANSQKLVQELQPTLKSIEASVETINTALSAFDLKDASSLIVDQLHQLRETLAALDFSKLPDAALSALHAGAQTLKALDVAGAVNPHLSEALAKVDPTPALESVAATLSAATGTLKAIDPASVVSQFDKPLDDLLRALEEFGPDKLRSLLTAAVHPLEEALRDIDFTTELAPVTRLYADLFARVDAVLNPDFIFTPLNELVRPVVAVIDAIQPARLLEFATSQAVPMGESTASSAKPPAAITRSFSTLKAIPQATEATEELFGFRPGDMLIPVIDLYRQLMETIDGFTDDLLVPAADLFQQLFSARLQSLFPSSVQFEVSAKLDIVIGEFDTSLVARRLLPAATAFGDFVSTYIKKSANLAPADAVVARRIGNLLSELDPLLLTPAPSQAEGVAAACAQVRAGLSLRGLQDVATHLASLHSMLPSFLRDPEVTVASLRQFLKDLDPTPVRIAINEAFDRIGARIVALQEPLMTSMDELMRLVEDFLLPVTPAALLELANRLHQAVREQLLAFHPNTFKDEVQLIFDIVKAQLTAFDPSVIVGELNQQRELLIKSLHDFITQIQPDLKEFLALQQNLAGLKPSEILKPAVESLKPVSELLAKIDIKVVLEPLIEAIERVRAQVPEVVVEIEAALDEVLDVIPEGGASSVSGSASFATA